MNVLFSTIVAYAFMLSGCSGNKSSELENMEPISEKKILIVYLSRTNNTKAVAQIIQKNVGGTLVALELQDPYPEHYQTTVDQVAEENRKGYLPPLKTEIDSIQNYDVVFIGFPTWAMQLPPPMKSFLKQYDLSGKTIVLFNTNAGYGVGSSFENIKELCKGCKVLEGFSIQGGKEKEGILLAITGSKETEAEKSVRQWLQKIGLIR